MNAYEYSMRKTAGLTSMLANTAVQAGGNMRPADVIKMTSLVVGGTMLGTNVLKSIYNKINNDMRRKAVIEDLAAHDPILSKVDRDQLKEWYATMYHYAPSLTADKATVRETLRGFVQFGRVDLKTLQMLAETENKMVSNYNASSIFDRLMPKVQI